MQIPDKKLLDKYDLWHESMSQREEYDVLNLPWYKTVISLLPDLSGKIILEVGCGRGIFANYLAQQFPTARVFAVDFSAKAIQLANQNSTLDNIDFKVGDAEALEFSENFFDYYISCETLEHVLNPKKMIMEAQRVLKKDGHFIITTENYFNGYILAWAKCWILKQPFASGCGIQPHENFFIFPMILNWLKKAGLTTSHTQSNHYQWLLLPGVSPSRLCTFEFNSSFMKRLAKPFGRHYTYQGLKE